jgi:hypothetical protein
MTTCLITFCHPPRYAARLHEPGVLREMVESHSYPFDDVLVVHQRCRAADYPPFDFPCRTVDLPEERFDGLFLRFNVSPSNPRADDLSHGPGGAHFWRWHLGNHLSGLENTKADYIVFADCDTKMVSQPPGRSWVEEAIYLLGVYPHLLIVGPGDGGESGGSCAEGGWIGRTRLTRNVSQQMFCCRGDEFRRKVNFDVPWDGRFDAPGGPMQEFYVMLEGRLSLYMRTTDQWRAILPDRWRYYHNSYWATDREPEGWGPYR